MTGATELYPANLAQLGAAIDEVSEQEIEEGLKELEGLGLLWRAGGGPQAPLLSADAGAHLAEVGPLLESARTRLGEARNYRQWPRFAYKADAALDAGIDDLCAATDTLRAAVAALHDELRG